MPEVPAGRRGHRRPGHEDLRGDRRGQLRLADPGQRLGDRRVRGQDHRLGGHHAARGARAGSSAAAGPGRPRPAPSGRAAPPAPAWAARRAGRRRRPGPSPPARRRPAPGPARRGSRPGRARAAPPARRRGARRPARRPPRCAGRRAGPAARWPGRPGACSRARRAATAVPCASASPTSPRTSSHSSWCRWPRRVSRPVCSRTATRLSDHSPVRSASIATSTTVAGRRRSPAMVTRRSSRSSRTSSSPGRFSNRRRLSVPVLSTTASASIEVTRPIGRKIRRRSGISATSPTTCGGRFVGAQPRDGVADPADLVAVGVEDGQAGEPREVNPRRHGHDPA